MSELTTPTTEILESYNAIRVAAQERHAALIREAAALEASFPGIGRNGNDRPAPANRRRYTPEQKADVVRRFHAGATRDEIALATGIPVTTLTNWVYSPKLRPVGEMVGSH